jgi:hypothetical protein
MKINTLTEFEEIFQNAIDLRAEFVAVQIQMAGFEEPEIIINKSENFEDKLAYYKNAYNEDLTLKTFNGIRIKSIAWAYEWDEIPDELNL